MARSRLMLLAGLAAGVLLAASLDPRSYFSEPRGDYESRRKSFVEYSANSRNHGLYVQVARLAAGLPVEEVPIRAAIQFVNERNDTADFRVAALVRIYREAKPGLISDALLADVRKTLLDFKYWCDEPGPDHLMGNWSENHQMLFHSSEYLAGQMFPDEVFNNNRQTGKRHMQHARGMTLKWLNTKAKAGFSEWDSNAYFPEDIASIINLADYAKDPEIAKRAAMLLDVMFFDMAVESLRGTYGTSHGRTYQGTVLSGRTEGTSGVEWVSWGLGSPGSPDNVATVFLSTSPRYKVPALIQAIAQDLPAEMTNRESQGLTIELAKQVGLRFEDPEDVFLLWDSGRLSNRRDAERSLQLLGGFNLHRYDVVIRPYAEAVVGTYKALEEMGVTTTGLDRTTLEQVQKITYRTPDYELSTAQDYRKGEAGYQQHIWQATLGPDNIVFTLNPSVSAKYWVGQFPKSVQHKNLLIAMYRIPSQLPPGPKTVFPPDASGNAMPSPGPSEEMPAGFTVAIFRRAAYDEVVGKNGWVFGRKGSGYVALRSQVPVVWSKDRVLDGEGLVAEGRKNVWICQMGRTAVDGPFAAWVEKIAAAKLSYDGGGVKFAAPGLGQAEMTWDEPLTIDGVAEVTRGYPRFDNPYCLAPWGKGIYDIHFRGRSLHLDFNDVSRSPIR